MYRNRGMIAGVCAACLGIGYFAGTNQFSFDESAGLRGQTQSSRQPSSTTRDRLARGGLLSEILNGRPLQDLSDGELVKIVVRLSKRDGGQDPLARARQAYQLQILLEKLPVSRLEKVAESIALDPESRRFGSLNEVTAALASKDSRRALAWAKEQKNARHLPDIVIGAMAKDDPFTAAELYRNGLLDGTFGRFDGYAASSGVGSAMAKLGRKPFMDFVDSLPLRKQSDVLSRSFLELPENEQSELIGEVYSRFKDGRIEDWTIKSIFNDTVVSDPELAEAWLAKLEPGKESASIALSTATFLSKINPEASREWMSRAISRSQGSEKELIQEAIRQISSQNPTAVATFASLLPDGVEIRAEDLKTSISSSISNNMSGLPELAGIIHDPAEQAKLITDVLDQCTKFARLEINLGKMNSTDFTILETKLKPLGLTGDNAAMVRTALDAARNASIAKDK